MQVSRILNFRQNNFQKTNNVKNTPKYVSSNSICNKETADALKAVSFGYAKKIDKTYFIRAEVQKMLDESQDESIVTKQNIKSFKDDKGRLNYYFDEDKNVSVEFDYSEGVAIYHNLNKHERYLFTLSNGSVGKGFKLENGINFTSKKMDSISKAQLKVQEISDKGALSDEWMETLFLRADELRKNAQSVCHKDSLVRSYLFDPIKGEERFFGHNIRKIDDNTFEIFDRDKNNEEKLVGMAKISLDEDDYPYMEYYDEVTQAGTNRYLFEKGGFNGLKGVLFGFKEFKNDVQTAQEGFFFNSYNGGLASFAKGIRITNDEVIFRENYGTSSSMNVVKSKTIDLVQSLKNPLSIRYKEEYNYDNGARLENYYNSETQDVIKFRPDEYSVTYSNQKTNLEYTFDYEDGKVGKLIK